MKRSWLVRVSLLVALGLPLGGFDALADAVGVADAKSIQAVVQSQLAALAEDDASKAFALATPSTRTQIGSPDNFLRMIKEQYTPIYRNRLAIFATPEIIDGDMIQIVRITADDSRVWLAVYRMEQDTDGNWKIDGCRLLETTSISI